MSDRHLEYSLNELPDMMELGVRQNMLSDKHKNLWPNAVSKFKKSIAERNPLNSYIHKNMNPAKISRHVNKTPIFQTVSAEPHDDYVNDWHISDGNIQLPMGNDSMWGVKVLDEWTKRSSLKQYEPYFEPTGRISDFAFLNTTNPVGIRFDTGIVETCQLVYKEQIVDEDLSCINFIVDIGKGANVTLEEFISPKQNGCKIIKITYLVRQGAKLEILRTTTPGNESLNIVDSKFICFPESDIIVNSKGKGSYYTQEFFDFDIYRSSQVCLDGRYNIKNEDNNHVGVLVNHLENDSISDIDVKTVVDGNSNSSFIGNIFVDKIARGTDAKLFNKNLLLSNKATAISEPQLDINTKDIECSHGCTVSNIDPQQLYLLNARGLDSHSARNILKECFLNQ
jgi:hypothetical protein